MTDKGLKLRNADVDHVRWLDAAGVQSFAGLRVLDLGCGSGYLCARAKSEGAVTAIGVDIVDPDNHPSAANAWTFLTLDLDDAAWDGGLEDRFDVIVAFDIVEHLASPYRFLRSCRNLLAPSGRLVLTTPNSQSWERRVKPWTWSGATDAQHKTLFSRYTLEFLLRRCDFKHNAIRAPLRKLPLLSPLNIGGQLLAVAAP